QARRQLEARKESSQDCGLRIADRGFSESWTTYSKVSRASKNHPQSAILDPQSAIRTLCSPLIHLFREKTGSKFSARPLIHCPHRLSSRQVATRPRRQKILFEQRDR